MARLTRFQVENAVSLLNSAVFVSGKQVEYHITEREGGGYTIFRACHGECETLLHGDLRECYIYVLGVKEGVLNA
mgnify:CR=1 FL=1